MDGGYLHLVGDHDKDIYIHASSVGALGGKPVVKENTPLFIALVVIGVLNVGVVGGIGFANLGHHLGWWSAAGFSGLNQTASIIMIATGGGAGLLLIIGGSVGLVKKEVFNIFKKGDFRISGGFHVVEWDKDSSGTGQHNKESIRKDESPAVSPSKTASEQLVIPTIIPDTHWNNPSPDEIALIQNANILSPYSHIFILCKTTGCSSPAFSDEGPFSWPSDEIYKTHPDSKKLLLIWCLDSEAKENMDRHHHNVFAGEKLDFPHIYKNMDIKIYYGGVTAWWSSTTLNSTLVKIISGQSD